MGDKISCKEAAELLGVSEDTAYRMFKKGLIGGHPALGRLVFSRKGIAKYLASNEMKPLAEAQPRPLETRRRKNDPAPSAFVYRYMTD